MIRHAVYTALNKPFTWFGVDTRIFMAAALSGMLVLLFSTSKLGLIGAFVLFLAVAGAGAMCSKHDPQFLKLFPIQGRLKKAYEAGKR